MAFRSDTDLAAPFIVWHWFPHFCTLSRPMRAPDPGAESGHALSADGKRYAMTSLRIALHSSSYDAGAWCIAVTAHHASSLHDIDRVGDGKAPHRSTSFKESRSPGGRTRKGPHVYSRPLQRQPDSEIIKWAPARPPSPCCHAEREERKSATPWYIRWITHHSGYESASRRFADPGRRGRSRSDRRFCDLIPDEVSGGTVDLLGVLDAALRCAARLNPLIKRFVPLCRPLPTRPSQTTRPDDRRHREK
jgi:hypothetical protein